MKPENKYNFEQQINRKYFVEYENIENFKDISGFNLKEKLFVVNVEKVTKTIDFQGGKEISSLIDKNVNDGIVSESILKKIIKEPHHFEKIKRSDQDTNFMFFHNDAIELLKKFNRKKELEDFNKENKISLMEALKNDDYQLYEYLKNDNLYHLFRNNNNEYIHEPIVLCYIEAGLDNYNYDLDTFAEYLSTKNNLSFIVEEGYGRQVILDTPLQGNEENIDRIIQDIPRYNAEEGKDETINLVYYPTSDELKEMAEWKYDKNSKIKEIFNLKNYIVFEMLGGKEFFKHHVLEDNKVLEQPKRKFKS